MDKYLMMGYGLEAPRLGMERTKGVWPPANPGVGVPPERDFWPLAPRPQEWPCAAIPRPLLLAFIKDD